MIVRHGPPSNLDTAPTGTLCKVSNSSNKVEIYKQISHDEENPVWILIEEHDASLITDIGTYTHTAAKKFTEHSEL
jgi:hypothetical protein